MRLSTDPLPRHDATSTPHQRAGAHSAVAPGNAPAGRPLSGVAADQTDRLPTTFWYRAARDDGTVTTGVVTAGSPEAVRSTLAGNGLWLLDLRHGSPRDRHQALSTQDLATGLRILATLLETGMPVGRALDAFRHMAPPAWTAMLPGITSQVHEGLGLATALERAPLALPPTIVGMLRAGEAGSGLARAVARAADHAEAEAAARAALQGALAYPMVLFIAGGTAIAVLVGVVLPRFAALLADLGQPLPTTTALVLSVGGGMRTSAPLVATAAFGGLVAWRAWTSTHRGRLRWHAWLLTLPVVGALRFSAATARICSAWAALLESGVPVVAALPHAGPAGGDAALARRVAEAHELVLQGGRLAQALDRMGAVTPGAIRLIRAGEESGQVARLLSHAAALESAAAERRLRALVRLLEPTLVLVFGGIVALVAASLLQAVYSVRPGP